MTAEKTVPKQLKPFQKGQSGNPSGRPKGARNKATLAMEILLEGEADRLTRNLLVHADDHVHAFIQTGRSAAPLLVFG
jgi:Family of unknown function (DUF5681)